MMSKHNEDASKRIAQHNLAHEVLCLIHSEKDAKEAAAQHAQLFKRKPTIQQLSPSNSVADTPDSSKPAVISNSLNRHAPITTVYDAPSLNVTLPASLVVDQPVARVLYSAGLVASRSEGHRLCSQEGAYVGSRPSNQGTMGDELEFTPCKNWQRGDTTSHIIDGKVLILRVGKWRMKIVRIVSDEEFEAKGLTAPGWPIEDKLDQLQGGTESDPDEETAMEGPDAEEAMVKYRPVMKPKTEFRKTLEGMESSFRSGNRKDDVKNARRNERTETEDEDTLEEESLNYQRKYTAAKRDGSMRNSRSRGQ